MNPALPLLEVAPLAFSAVLVLTPPTRRFARAIGYVDHPETRKSHAEPTPLLGGLAVGLALIAGPMLARIFASSAIQPPRVGLVVGALISLTLGLLDDRLPLGPRGKLLGQALAAACLVWWGTDVEAIRRNLLLGILAMIGVATLLNAVNFLDNMDGILGSVIPITAGGFVALGLIHGAPVELALAWGLVGACSGFLVYNAPPARIFLGDAGSHLLGFALAALAFQSLEGSLTWPHVAALIVILAYPIFDAVFVVVDRILGNRPIYLGSMDHTTHRLGRVVGQWRMLGILVLATCVNAGAGVWMWGRSDPLSIVVPLCGLGLLYAIFAGFLRRISPTSQFVI